MDVISKAENIEIRRGPKTKLWMTPPLKFSAANVKPRLTLGVWANMVDRLLFPMGDEKCCLLRVGV